MIGVDSPGNNKGLLLWLPVSLLKLPCSEVKSRGGAPIGIQVCPMKDIRNGDKGRGSISRYDLAPEGTDDVISCVSPSQRTTVACECRPLSV